jgi:hypothetical protein
VHYLSPTSRVSDSPSFAFSASFVNVVHTNVCDLVFVLCCQCFSVSNSAFIIGGEVPALRSRKRGSDRCNLGGVGVRRTASSGRSAKIGSKCLKSESRVDSRLEMSLIS